MAPAEEIKIEKEEKLDEPSEIERVLNDLPKESA